MNWPDWKEADRITVILDKPDGSQRVFRGKAESVDVAYKDEPPSTWEVQIGGKSPQATFAIIEMSLDVLDTAYLPKEDA